MIFQKIDIKNELIVFIENSNIQEIQLLKDLMKAEEKRI
jgi:hypothetical protein